MEISLVSKLVIIRWQILFLSRKKGMLKSLVPTQTMQQWEFNWTNKVFCNVWMCHEFGSSKAFSKQKFHIHTSYNASCFHDLITRGKYSGGAKKASHTVWAFCVAIGQFLYIQPSWRGRWWKFDIVFAFLKQETVRNWDCAKKAFKWMALIFCYAQASSALYYLCYDCSL